MVSTNPMLVNPLLNVNYIPSDSLEKSSQKAVSLEKPALKSEKTAKTASSQKTKIAFVAGLALGVLGGYLLRGVQNANTGQVNLCARPPVSCPAPVSCPSSVGLHNDSMLQGIVFKALQSETQGQNNPQSQLPILPTISLPTELLSSTPQSSAGHVIQENHSPNNDSAEVQNNTSEISAQQISQLDLKIEQLAKDAPVCTDPEVHALEEKANASQQIMDYIEVGRQYSKLGNKNPGFYHKAVYWFYQGAKQGDIDCMQKLDFIMNQRNYTIDKSIYKALYKEIFPVYAKANDKIIESMEKSMEKHLEPRYDQKALEESWALELQYKFRLFDSNPLWYGKALSAYKKCGHRQCNMNRGDIRATIVKLKAEGKITAAQAEEIRAYA